MPLLALFFSAHGRILPKPFTLGILAVYVAALLSLLLVSSPLLERAGWLAFVLMQATVTWAWFCLHAKRLRDAERGIRPAVAVAVLYALAMVLLLLLVLLAGATQSDATAAPSASLADFLIPAFLLPLLDDGSAGGLFAQVVAGILVLIIMPIAMAVGLSIWSGSRPSVTTMAP